MLLHDLVARSCNKHAAIRRYLDTINEGAMKALLS